jgi:YidC/Oxa1 family membrane protein insertase
MDKKFFIALFLSLGTVLLLQYFFTSKDNAGEKYGAVVIGQEQKVSPGEPVKVPTTQDLLKPLNYSVDFIEKKLTAKEEIEEVDTKLCKVIFSNYGAVISDIYFKEHEGKNKTPLRTIYKKSPLDENERAQSCFLLAFDANTPFIYSHIGTECKKINGQDVIDVIYQCENDDWKVKKIFTIYKNLYQIDVSFLCEPKALPVKKFKMRLFLPAPILNEIGDDSTTVFSFNEIRGDIDRIEVGKEQGLAWHWQTPQTLFGADDRYFAHALIKDQNKFVQRAYVKRYDKKSVVSIFEGPEIINNYKGSLSFYIGPKLYDHLGAVDDRLSDLMSFGWFSWFCKILLRLLDFVFNYVGNYGVAIILLTLLLRVPFMPLSIYSRKRMEEYQKHQPNIQKIRAKYKHDMQMQHEEIMKYHNEHNLSTATPVLGCLPLLIQVPILFGLYRILWNYLDLYQAPFFGWLVDLSSKDPYYILPALMCITMVWQQMMAPSVDGKQKVMMLFFSIIITVLFISAPAGLVLYWFMNNIITIGEDYLRKLFLK